MYEETHEEASARRRDRAISRLSRVVLAMARERHYSRKSNEDTACSAHDFDMCSDDVCRDAQQAAEVLE